MHYKKLILSGSRTNLRRPDWLILLFWPFHLYQIIKYYSSTYTMKATIMGTIADTFSSYCMIRYTLLCLVYQRDTDYFPLQNSKTFLQQYTLPNASAKKARYHKTRCKKLLLKKTKQQKKTSTFTWKTAKKKTSVDTLATKNRHMNFTRYTYIQQ